MPGRMLRIIVIAAVGLCGSAFSGATERPHDASAQLHRSAASLSKTTAKSDQHALRLKRRNTRGPAADRDPYADPAAPYKANRLSSSRGEPILSTPGQTTVLTRQILDDMNATSLGKTLNSTAGVTVR